MDLRLKGRTAVVGGASSGLGRASVMRFAEAGSESLTWARGDEALERTRSDLVAAGAPRTTAPCRDIRRPGHEAPAGDARDHDWGRLVAILSGGVRESVPGLPNSNIGRSGSAAWTKSESQLVAADGDPDEFGVVVAFLCSDPAAYVNGPFVPVDGDMLKSLG